MQTLTVINKEQAEMLREEFRLVNIEELKDCYLFSLTLRRWGNRAKIRNLEAHEDYLKIKRGLLPDMSFEEWLVYRQSGKLPEQAGANGKGALIAVDLTSSTRTLLVSDALDKCNEFLTGIKDSLCGPIRGRANRSFVMEGLFAVRKALAPQFKAELEAAKAEIRATHIPAIIADFEPAKERARTRKIKDGGAGPLYNEADYPPATAAAGKFDLEWQFMKISVPDDLPAEMREAEENKLRAKMANAAEEIQAALRECFQELVSHFVDKLTVAPGDKPKVFRDTLVSNIDDFLKSFEARNMGDKELESLVQKARTVLSPNGQTVDPDRLRKFASVRDDYREKFNQIKTSLDGMIIERKSRKIDVSED